MSQLLGRPIGRQRGWEYLKAMEYRLRVPRLRTPTPQSKRPGKKKLQTTVAQVQQAYPDAVVEVWAEDEHRCGLKPVLLQAWFAWYEAPVAPMRWQFEWAWLDGWVCQQTGQTYWWLMPRVNTETFSRVLQDFARHFGVGSHKRLILVLDQARWHTTLRLVVPEGIYLVFLPAYSPELQPAERLWPLTNEAIAHQYCETISEVEAAICHRCQELLKCPELIRGLTQFHWWPTVPPT
jgi:transposase